MMVVVPTPRASEFSYTYPRELDVTEFGVLPDNTDHTAELVTILENYPDAPLYFPQGLPNNRYKFALDVNETPNRATQETNLGSRSAQQKTDWEYTPKWRGDAPTGDPEESGTIIAVADASVTPYALRFTRRSADTTQFWQQGHFRDLRFWGETGDESTGQVLVLDQTGYRTTFDRCVFERCDNPIKMTGVFGCVFSHCVIGGVNVSTSDVGLWLVASTQHANTYAGFMTFDNCHFNCKVSGVFSDNRAHNAPAIGDRFRNNQVYDNQLGLVYYGYHCGSNWHPVRFEGNYTEAINTAGATFDLSPYGGPASVNTSANEAYRFLGQGVYDLDKTNRQIHLAIDPDAGADLYGPTCYLKYDRYAGEHSVDADSELVVQNAYVFGAFGGTKNRIAERVYTIDESVDQHSCCRMRGHFTNRAENVSNYFASQHVNDDFNFGAGSGTVTTKDRVGSPGQTLVREILLPAGGTEQVSLEGLVGGINYTTAATAQASWKAFTFAIRAVSSQPLTLTIRNSRHTSNLFSQDIALENDEWHSYCIVAPRGDSSFHYVFGNNDVSNAKTFQIADIQAVAFADRQQLREFLDQRSFATGRTDSLGASIAGNYYLEKHAYIDARRDFGLLADGSDETTLVQQIVDNAHSAGESRIKWPQGRIKLSATINLNNMRGVTWEGAGAVGGLIGASYFSTANTGGTIFEWDGTTGQTGTNLTVHASDNTKVQPDGYTPTAKDVDTFINISAGAGFTTGYYRITAQDGTYWTLDASPAATSTAGGTWELDYPEMFFMDGCRFFHFTDMTFSSSLITGTGKSVGRVFHLSNVSDAGDGHWGMDNVSFYLQDRATAIECGVQAPKNAADIKLTRCEFWGNNLGNGWQTRENHVLICNDLQNVNYRFSQCVFAFIHRLAWMKFGGSVHVESSDGFELASVIKSDSTGVNNGMFRVAGCRFDRNTLSPYIPCTVFDTVDSNAEPHICSIENCLFTSAGGAPFGNMDPMIKARHQCHVTVKNCDLRHNPPVRFYANDYTTTGKTALTSCVTLENCEIPAARPVDYIQGASGSSGKLIQIDQTEPGFGYFKMANCRFTQRPVDDFEAGANPGYFHRPDTEKSFSEWLNAQYSVVALWEMDEPAESKQIKNYATGGSPFSLPSVSGTNLSVDASDATKVSPVVHGGTAEAGAATTITLAASASADDDEYNNMWVRITGGRGSGQTRQITDYAGAIRVATVAAWTTDPDATSVYIVSDAGEDDVDLEIEVTGGTGFTTGRYWVNAVASGQWTLDRSPAPTSTANGLWRTIVKITGAPGPIGHQTGCDFAIAKRGRARGAFNTGVTHNFSTTSCTIFGFFDRYAREPATTQTAMMISDTDGDARDDTSRYLAPLNLNSGSNFDWYLTEDDADPADPDNTIWTRAEGPGYLPMVWTWDHTAGTNGQWHAWIAGQKTDVGSPPFDSLHIHEMTSAATFYIGGLRQNGSAFGDTTREWHGRMGRVGVVSGVLTDPQIAELFGQMTMTGRASYARPRTP